MRHPIGSRSKRPGQLLRAIPSPRVASSDSGSLLEPRVDELEDAIHVQVAVLLVSVGVVAIAAVGVRRVAVELHVVSVRAHEALLPGSELIGLR